MLVVLVKLIKFDSNKLSASFHLDFHLELVANLPLAPGHHTADFSLDLADLGHPVLIVVAESNLSALDEGEELFRVVVLLLPGANPVPGGAHCLLLRSKQS